ncbi:platelet-activating factor acetylhydrolase isoform X2 [Protopterus annectens]|uniref:platelet-activating factor acetylhydrolase isoform X2 n=1 Tax=Protopterus annectens TaxID=7888 RepID=UPI001CFC16A3|nr:platelet-activating factor acetylhydrolase isoform X2 [Protopterus annectens]
MGSSNSTQSFGIPHGKGPHSVGCTDVMADHTVQGSFLRLFYPCTDAVGYEEPLWIPRKEYYNGLADFMKLNRRFADWIFERLYGSYRCPAKWNAPFKVGEKYPLIIFSHGLGAFRTVYSAICIEMASLGFVVAAVEHRDESASATYCFEERLPSDLQEQVLLRTDECIRALNLICDINGGKQVTNALPLHFDFTALKASIDVCRIAVMGHSFGGATVIETLSKEARISCGIALDAWMFPLSDEFYRTVRQPLLFINSETFQWAGNIMKMKKLESCIKEWKMITVKGTVHQSFPDFTFLTGSLFSRIFKLKGNIHPHIAIDITNKASAAFFQKHLGLEKDFNQWDHLIDGKGEHILPGTNVSLPLS